jgi:hypothetical protein
VRAARQQLLTDTAVDARCPPPTAETTNTPVRLTLNRYEAAPELLVVAVLVNDTVRPRDPPAGVALRSTTLTREFGAKPETFIVKLFDMHTPLAP